MNPLHLLSVPLLIALNAFFVVAEYAVVSSRPAQVDAMRRRGWRRTAEATSWLTEDVTSSIGAIQVCITMTNLLLGWIGEPAMSALLQWMLGPVIRLAPTVMTGVSIALSFIIVTLLTVVFSELLPKALTLRFTEPAALLTAVPICAIRRFVSPLVWIMNKLANAITRPLGLGRVEDFERTVVTPDELRVMAMQAASDGTVTERERAMIFNSLAISARLAREIMIPRVKVAALDLKKTMDENRRVMNERLFTRLPLCDGGLDHIIGVVRTKEFLSAYNAAGDSSVLSLIALPPVYVPEMVHLDRLLATFLESGSALVFLVDEYGGVEGIATLQDLLRELVSDRHVSADAQIDGELKR